MKLEDVLQELSVLKDFDKLEPNDAGIYYVTVDEKHMIAIESSLDEKGFYVYASVGILPQGKEKELGLQALSGNLFGKETGRACLGFHPNTGSLILFQYFSEDSVNMIDFVRDFDLFIDYLAYWFNKVKSEKEQVLEKVSLEKHLFDLTEHQKLKVFFA